MFALGEMALDPKHFETVIGKANREITLWLKRMRKKSDFRYLLVAEAHKSGAPHFHALIHEMDPLRPCRERDMRKAWRGIGFLHAKLIREGEDDAGRASHYLTKYISKSMIRRVRASFRYGSR